MRKSATISLSANVGTIQVILKANRFTKAPEGLIYYRICEPGDICRVVRGALAALRLVEDMPP